jgi:hypothetical protein
VEAVVDQLEPMLPPKMGEPFRSRFDQAFEKGEPDGARIKEIIDRRENELINT